MKGKGSMKKGNSERTGSPPRGVVGVVQKTGGRAMGGKMGPAMSKGGRKK